MTKKSKTKKEIEQYREEMAKAASKVNGPWKFLVFALMYRRKEFLSFLLFISITVNLILMGLYTTWLKALFKIITKVFI